jgi:hypothetical protein
MAAGRGRRQASSQCEGSAAARCPWRSVLQCLSRVLYGIYAWVEAFSQVELNLLVGLMRLAHAGGGSLRVGHCMIANEGCGLPAAAHAYACTCTLWLHVLHGMRAVHACTLSLPVCQLVTTQQPTGFGLVSSKQAADCSASENYAALQQKSMRLIVGGEGAEVCQGACNMSIWVCVSVYVMCEHGWPLHVHSPWGSATAKNGHRQ